MTWTSARKAYDDSFRARSTNQDVAFYRAYRQQMASRSFGTDYVQAARNLTVNPNGEINYSPMPSGVYANNLLVPNLPSNFPYYSGYSKDFFYKNTNPASPNSLPFTQKEIGRAHV